MKTINYYLYFLAYWLEINFEILFSKGVEKSIWNAKLWILLQHHKVRQRYDSKYPYYYHLKMVCNYAKHFGYIMNDDSKIYLGALFHDTIEDLHMFTYNDIKKIWGEEVADIVYACTELRGKNREERHGADYYKLLQENEFASYVKICDVMANMTQGMMTGSSMLAKYQKDYPKFKTLLYRDKFKDMFNYMEDNLL